MSQSVIRLSLLAHRIVLFVFFVFTYVNLRDLVYLYEMRSQTLGTDNYVTGTFFKTLVVKVAERTPQEHHKMTAVAKVIQMKTEYFKGS